MVMLVQKKENKRQQQQQQQQQLPHFSAMKTYKKRDPKDIFLSLNILSHPFLVSLHCSFQTEKKNYLLMDYIEGGELFYHLNRKNMFLYTTCNNIGDKKDGVGDKNEFFACFYGAEICCGLEYLHKNSVSYGNLKPENILLSKEVSY